MSLAYGRAGVISIHALHEESDERCDACDYLAGVISIHALHEESDPLAHQLSRLIIHFNPRSP